MGASYFVGLLIGTLASVVVASWVMGLFMGAAYPALGALVGEIQPSERRTFGFAAQIAPAFFIGGFAPLVIGAMSDAFGSLRAASALFTALISLIGVVVLFSSRLVTPTPS
jgi:MFS family permease